MFVEFSPIWAVDVITMCVNSGVGGGLTFPYILGFGAEGAMGQVNTIPASAVKVVQDIKFLTCGLALEGFRGYHEFATDVLPGC